MKHFFCEEKSSDSAEDADVSELCPYHCMLSDALSLKIHEICEEFHTKTTNAHMQYYTVSYI